MTRSRNARTPLLPPHPRAGEAWFAALPAEHREEIERARQADFLHDQELLRRERRRPLVEAGRMAALFAATAIALPHRSLLGFLAMSLGGAVFGWLAERFRLERFGTCALGLATVAALQWSLLGGLTVLHFFAGFPFAAGCAYVGYLREERGAE